ncbi:MAG: ligand-binding protein SH3 [Desulfurococcales archaeon ex4484_58]|nr:MAG: ligand-binding protein SH3 [Desulfurococcales archaeon ex4484_58]
MILLALTPGIEARGAYPMAFYLGLLNPYTYLLIYVFSSFPSIPIIYGLKWVERKLIIKSGLLARIYTKILERVRRKSVKVSKYKVVYVGLILYVAVPLPLTGVWTGSLIAYLMDLDKKRSIIAVFIGNLIACTIIYLTLFTPQLLR